MEAQLARPDFFEGINWEEVTYNVIDKQSYDKIIARYAKIYATFLGREDELSYFMFKSLSWPEFKDIRSKKLDKDATHDYILNTCVLWPKLGIAELNELDAGIALTLVYQILTMSNFFKDPSKALELILEVK